MSKPPTLPELVHGWRALLEQFETRSTRLLVAGEALQHMAAKLHELGDVHEARYLWMLGGAIFNNGCAAVDPTAADELERVKKGTPPDTH